MESVVEFGGVRFAEPYDDLADGGKEELGQSEYSRRRTHLILATAERLPIVNADFMFLLGCILMNGMIVPDLLHPERPAIDTSIGILYQNLGCLPTDHPEYRTRHEALMALTHVFAARISFETAVLNGRSSDSN